MLRLRFALVALMATAASAAELPFLEHARVDPAKIMTAEACGECHISEFDVWKRTPHATSFMTLHRKEQAEAIARKMGFRLIKRDSLCFSCHYTPIVDDDEIRVVSGVSCESCHGAGAGWIEVHNDYGPGKKFAGESEEHRRQRIGRSREAGMRRPSDLYPVVANCFSCHTVPNEKLVNVGGHNTGSAGFEFVAWQEKIRHNFLDSLRTGTLGANSRRSPERQRLMYVVGRALDLEYSLRGVAVASDDGVYAKAMMRRVRSALAELRAIDGAAALPQVAAMLAAVREVSVVPRNEAPLLAAAERIGAQTRALLVASEELRIAALDPLLQGLDLPGEPAADESTEGRRAEGIAAAAPDQPAPGGAAIAPGAAIPADPRPGATAAAAQPGAVGEFKRRVRQASRYRTLGPSACSGCHTRQNEWWFGDAHYRSADPFFDGAADNRRIARLYGLSPAQMTRGSQVCMDCHGTIVSGKESREVLDGVSCESCHGAAADWLEPHKDETDKQLGQRRPGHLAALERGKRRLRDQAVRARACADCHYVTEPRLLSAGHPSGDDFDYPRGIAASRHWEHAAEPATELAGAFAAVRSERGPVPEVRQAVLSPATEAPQRGEGAEPVRRPTLPRQASSRAAAFADPRTASVTALRPPRPRPVVRAAALAGSGREVQLPPFPEIGEATPVEEALRRLGDRLRLLYRVTAGGDEGGSR